MDICNKIRQKDLAYWKDLNDSTFANNKQPLSPHFRGEEKISTDKNKEKIEKYICLFLSVDILLLD